MTIMETPFLRSLQPVDMRTRPAKVAQQYMALKGFRDVRPLGVVPNETSWYFYYELDDGLLELEVSRESGETYTRKVTGLITDRDQLRDYLGR